MEKDISKDKKLIRRRYINKAKKNRLESVLILQGSSGTGDVVRQKIKILKSYINQRKKMQESYRTMIQKVRQTFPIVCDQNIKCIGKKGGYINFRKIPMTEDLLRTEFYNIYIRLRAIKAEKSQHQGYAIVKTKLYNHTENTQMNKGEKQSTIMRAETPQKKQQNLLPEQKINYRINIIEEKKRYLQCCIQQLDKIINKWKQPQWQPLLGKIIEIESSQLAGKVDQKNIKANKKSNPKFSEQEQINIQNLSLKHSQLLSQTNLLKNYYYKLLKKTEHIFPRILEDQKSKSQRIEVKHPQSSSLIHYASLPMSSKDLYDESARIRARLHKQLKKNMKIHLSQQRQFDKTKASFQIKIKVLYFRREYLQKAIEKIKNYTEDDKEPLLQLQNKQKQNNEQLNQVSQHEKCIQRRPLGNEGEIFVDQIPDKINVMGIVFHSEQERKKYQQLCRQLLKAQTQNQELKKKYFHLVRIASEINAPFFNEDDFTFIQLKGSKNQQTNIICTSEHSLQQKLHAIDNKHKKRINKMENRIKKQWKKINPHSDQQLNLQKSENDKKAFIIKRMRFKSEFMRESIVAFEQYISKWKQIISSQNTLFIKEKEKCLDKRNKQ